MSVIGMFALVVIAVLFSENRKAIKLRTVGGAFAIQAGFAALVLYIPAGQSALASLSEGVQHVINYADAGIGFLFGDLGKQKLGFIFAFNVLPVLIFFSSLVAVLYYLGIMQKIVGVIGTFFYRVLGTGHTESLSATANIFVSQTEAPLIIRPYIAGMTRSELFAVMVGGMASIAGSLLVGYANMGVDLKYLIAASFMAAPGGLLMAKLMIPEEESLRDTPRDIVFDERDRPANVIDAAASGALSGMQLALNIGAMLIAFIALIALINGAIGGVFSWFGLPEVTLQGILGAVFSPIAYILGIPWSESITSGSLIGQKLVLNEFVAYADFVSHKEALSPHAQVVVTFALCGFANFSSIAILLGGLGSLAPLRRPEIARLGLKAVLAGTLANLMSAALAGFFTSL
ncbi:NupC/NupG family nucleoside CNT transporter [Microbulbifer harenosus]|uniref:Nucleoside permease n=1 Tax=Microbulbifer harenosus TaxID=2576840 RepID=A0ABY2UGW7_9GAMM|nr:NupC/NupG family nucleoside CNT transporter [Microbulbifer harenosus]TLM77003.1 NupC/NupG family nucleoside CNT transporter [Microbulbifer harenosus]